MDDLFNNATVAAFFGAFAAFLLVAATDLRRRYMIRSLLNRQIKDAIELSNAKIETVRMNMALVREDNRITVAPIMLFPLKPIEDYRLQVLDLLSSAQAQALDVLAYWMKAIDGLLGEAIAVAGRVKVLSQANAPDAESRALAEEYLDLMGEAEKNMLYLVKMLEHYVAKRPENILGFKHPVGEPR
jgi:predicted RNA-binding protein with PUA-like domain